ncbi:WD40-repeat-containing domain protein [Mycena alexandri]|uniref:WD40-repeat-containing domain protein n=1 Tax=Mycena alexandri TaxID=1745969 RepID=A0AAD6WYC0_9AGAR|nr:WD40-repeat-containing domain protein [Mycena alexandri]
MKAPERPAKKARVDPPKLSASRVKGSPVPQKKAQPAKSSLKGKEKATTATAAAAAATTPAPTRKPRRPLPSTFKSLLGPTKNCLYGLEGTVSFEADTSALSFHLKPVFIFPAHVSCIKAVAAWDLCLFRARDWAVLRALRGHKGRVNSVAVHPSGKVALSVGKDRTLRITKLGKEAELVRWSSDGSLFVVQVASTIDVYTTDMNLLHTITHPARLHDVQFCKRVNGEGDVLLAGAEDKKLAIYALSTDPETPPRIIAEMTGHANRSPSPPSPSPSPPAALAAHGASTTVVCTVSSDGKILLYDLAALPAAAACDGARDPAGGGVRLEGTRLTCVTVADGEVEGGGMGGKRKRAGGEEGAADEGDSGWEDEAEEEGEVESD